MATYATKKRQAYFDLVRYQHDHQGLSAHKIAERLPISEMTVSRWLAESEPCKMGVSAMADKKKTVEYSEPKDLSEARKQIRLLKKELLKAQVREEAWSHMIDIAEQRFQIPIRKKPGAKQ